MAMIFDWREVFRRPVAIAGHQIQVVCTARMSGCGTLFPLLLLVIAQCREHVRPGFDAQVADFGRSSQPLADRCAAVVRAILHDKYERSYPELPAAPRSGSTTGLRMASRYVSRPIPLRLET